MAEVLPFLKGFLSQWHRSHFTLHEIEFVNAEQYMMYRKAKLFGDDKMAERIMKSIKPHEQKLMGRNVKGFNESTWSENKIDIVYTGNLAKFSQNSGLRRRLLATGDLILAEANPKDPFWGIGLAVDDPDVQDPAMWKGENLLGKVLMRVREELR